MLSLLAHGGQPLRPHDLWGAWSPDPFVLGGLLLLVALYVRGRRGAGPTTASPRAAGAAPASARAARAVRRARRRDLAFGGAVLALLVAFVSPVEALAGALAAGHMLQHTFLLLVAAPLLAASAPSSRVLRGSPPAVQAVVTRARRVARPVLRRAEGLGGPVGVWVLYVVGLWTWHAAGAYEAALRWPAVHVLEHATFLGTGVLFWRVVLGARGGVSRVPPGVAALLVFGAGMQGVLLSVLLTFARTAWYPAYGDTSPWGLTPLADQQLAGVLLWIPGSIVHVGVALTLVARWLRAQERADAATAGGLAGQGAGARPSPSGGAPARAANYYR